MKERDGTQMLRFEQEGEEPIDAAHLESVLARIRQIHPKTRSFFSLTAPDGSYVQGAGAPLRLILEWRNASLQPAEQYVLGRPGREERWTSINYSGGAISLRMAEILSISDAERVAAQFFQDQTVPADYTLRDVTDEVSSPTE